MQMSHGLAIILLLVYITSRIFVHNPPGEGNGMEPAPGAPPEIHAEEDRLRNERPKVASGFCILLLVSTIVVLAFTGGDARQVDRTCASRWEHPSRVVWLDSAADCVVQRGWRGRVSVLHSCDTRAASYTCEGACHRPQCAVHDLLDAFLGAAWLVDKQTLDSSLWYAQTYHNKVKIFSDDAMLSPEPL